MRYRRLTFVVGWIAVALLAIAGFAAFSEPGPSADEVRVEAAAASMGHASGAYAGLAFALVGQDSASVTSAVSTDGQATDSSDIEEAEAAAKGTESVTETTKPAAAGWLSEVEVRALVSLYFEPEDVNRAVRVAWCESRFDPEAIDLRTGAVGLFKHLPRYWEERADSAGFAGADPTDPEASTAAAAWAIYEGGGWDVFACRG